MATTDAKAGFRLPWSSDRPATDPAADSASPELEDGGPAPSGAAEETSQDRSPGAEVETRAEAVPAADAGEAAPRSFSPAPVAPTRKPSRFLADMTKAMRAAAEDARARSLIQLQADAKAHIESIHGRSASDAAGLRKAADDDVAAVREWSKAEIARIREETDARIADRKSRLEREIEGHAAVIEREIEAVQGTVASFEAEMAAFFERLLAEEDPTHFATLFESMPEPPALDAIVVAPEAVVAPVDVPAAEHALESAPVAEADDEPADDQPAVAEIEAAVADSEPAVVDDDETPIGDPRFAALGLSPDFGAAEAEALADAGSTDDEEIEIPVIGDEALSARLAGLVPGAESPGETVTTQVIVVGLISVASIASFKRHLGRLPGVSSVGVSSGPEGEFVFAVGHAPDVVLRDLVPGLPAFQARVTGSSGSAIHVTAHDPESDA